MSLTPEMRQLDLTPKLISYLKTIQKRYSNPLVELRNGACLGCFITLSSAQRQEIVGSEGYGICDNCGRILYLDEY
jgi:predicted  nucleic acid-binding Zn-ribbon protein